MAHLNATDHSPIWGELTDGFLRSYAEVLFSSLRLVGLVFLAATFVHPMTGLYGVAAVFIGLLTTRSLGFSDEANRHGLFAYNALLGGLAIGAGFEPGLASAVLLVGATITVVVVTAGLRSMFGVFSQPTLSLPFLLVVLALLAAAPTLGLSHSYAAFHLGQSYAGLPTILTDFFVTLGAIFFVPHPLAGLIVFAGLVISSRIATLLALIGYGLATGMGAAVAPVIAGGDQLFLTITTTVVAIAVGGIWFVPSVSSMLLVVGSTIVGGVFAVANYSLLREVGYPVLFLPMNVTIWLVLFAMRQRMRDDRPKAVEVVGGSPEQNLAYYRNRVARFGAHYFLRFRAPFMGRWICTQSAEGDITHRGYWKHALDFEVAGADGLTFAGEGADLHDYHCYGLPVVAAADGTVVRVLNTVPDNAPGEVNLRQNWGNHVLIYHGGGIYSLCAHLMPDNVKVWEGKVVRAGDEIGRCGNSGRSPVPHLHFQLQASPVVGAPTVVTELHDVIVRMGDHDEVVNTIVPAKGQELRNIQPESDIADLLGLHRSHTTFRSAEGRVERIETSVDLQNRRVARSDRGAALYYDYDDLVFTIFDVEGPRDSVLHLIRAALGRVPFEVGASLRWHDHLPARFASARVTRWCLDFIAPFLPDGGVRMRYDGRREGRELVVEGASQDGRGRSVQTVARLDAHGIRTVQVTIGDRTRRFERVDVDVAHEAAPLLSRLEPEVQP